MVICPFCGCFDTHTASCDTRAARIAGMHDFRESLDALREHLAAIGAENAALHIKDAIDVVDDYRSALIRWNRIATWMKHPMPS